MNPELSVEPAATAAPVGPGRANATGPVGSAVPGPAFLDGPPRPLPSWWDTSSREACYRTLDGLAGAALHGDLDRNRLGTLAWLVSLALKAHGAGAKQAREAARTAQETARTAGKAGKRADEPADPVVESFEERLRRAREGLVPASERA